MPRNRRSAKAAGSRFEKLVADYLASTVDDRIERRAKTGAKDRGDIGGVRFQGHRVVVECKDTARMALPQWAREAAVEAENDGALLGVVAHKRHGSNQAEEQWVTMTLADFARLLATQRSSPLPTNVEAG